MTTTIGLTPSGDLVGIHQKTAPLAIDSVGYTQPEQLASMAAAYSLGDGSASQTQEGAMTLPELAGSTLGTPYRVGSPTVNSTSDANSYAAHSIAYPAGTAVGDVVLLAVAYWSDQLTGAPDTPSGFTLAWSYKNSGTYDIRLSLFYRVVTGSEGSTVTVDGSTSVPMMCGMETWREVDTSSPFDATETGPVYNSTGNPDPASITTSTPNAAVVSLVAGQKWMTTTATPPSGFTESIDTSGSHARSQLMTAHLTKGTPGAENPGVWGYTPDQSIAMTIALRPAGVSPPRTILVAAASADETESAALTGSDCFLDGANAVQQLDSVLGSGTFTLTYDGQTTGAIAYNATSGDIGTALAALSNLASADLRVTGGALDTNPVFVEFINAEGGTDQPLMTSSSGDVAVSEVVEGFGSVAFNYVGAVNVPKSGGGITPQIFLWELTPANYEPGRSITFDVADHGSVTSWAAVGGVWAGLDTSTPVEVFGTETTGYGQVAEIGPLNPSTRGSLALVMIAKVLTTGNYSAPAGAGAPARTAGIGSAVGDRMSLDLVASPPLDSTLFDLATSVWTGDQAFAVGSVALKPANPPSTISTSSEIIFDDFSTLGTYDSGAFGSEWQAYDSPGNAGYGLRRTTAVSIVDSTSQPLLAGDPPTSNGTAAQISATWDGSDITSGIVQWVDRPIRYGRVRFRAKASGDPSDQLSPVLLMWPATDNNPAEGEIDMWEGIDGRITLNPMKSFLHRANPDTGLDEFLDPLVWAIPDVPYDALGTDWHTYEMVWEPGRIDITMDDIHTQSFADPAWIPTEPMKFSIQLDAWGNAALGSDVHMWLDWVSIQENILGGVDVLGDQTTDSWLELAASAGDLFEVIEFDLSGLPGDAFIVGASVRFRHESGAYHKLRVVPCAITDAGQAILGEDPSNGYAAEPIGEAIEVTTAQVDQMVDGSDWNSYSRLGVAIRSSAGAPGLDYHRIYWAELRLHVLVGGPVVSNVSGPAAAGDPITWDYSSAGGHPPVAYQVMVVGGSDQDPDEAAVGNPWSGDSGIVVYDSGMVHSADVRSVLTDSPLSRGGCTYGVRAWARMAGRLVPSDWATINIDIAGSAPGSPVVAAEASFDAARGTVSVDITTPADATRIFLHRSVDGGTVFDLVGEPVEVGASSTGTITDPDPPYLTDILYRVGVDSGPHTESSWANENGLAAARYYTPSGWYLQSMTDPTLNATIDVIPLPDRIRRRNTQTITGVDAHLSMSTTELGSILSTSIRCSTAAQLADLNALLAANETLRLTSILGDTWWVKPVGDIGETMQRWQPLGSEATALRNAHILDIEWATQAPPS